ASTPVFGKPVAAADGEVVAMAVAAGGIALRIEVQFLTAAGDDGAPFADSKLRGIGQRLPDQARNVQRDHLGIDLPKTIHQLLIEHAAEQRRRDLQRRAENSGRLADVGQQPDHDVTRAGLRQHLRAVSQIIRGADRLPWAKHPPLQKVIPPARQVGRADAIGETQCRARRSARIGKLASVGQAVAEDDHRGVGGGCNGRGAGARARLFLREAGRAAPVDGHRDQTQQDSKSDDPLPAESGHQPAADDGADRATEERGGHIKAVDAALSFRVDRKGTGLVGHKARLYADVEHDDPDYKEDQRGLGPGEEQEGQGHNGDAGANYLARAEGVRGTTAQRSGKCAGRTDDAESTRPGTAHMHGAIREQRGQVYPEGVEARPQQRLDDHRFANRAVVAHQRPQRSQQTTARQPGERHQLLWDAADHTQTERRGNQRPDARRCCGGDTENEGDRDLSEDQFATIKTVAQRQQQCESKGKPQQGCAGHEVHGRLVNAKT
nr:hypothetical protein [Tanacetum cinerariifolium]